MNLPKINKYFIHIRRNLCFQQTCLVSKGRVSYSLLREIYRRMSTDAPTTHMERTAQSSRSNELCKAMVMDIRSESPSVKGLTLSIESNSVSFKAGQWVDTYISGVETFTGFSICSSPSKLMSDRKLDLAIKYSSHPSVHWIHTKCKIGDELSIRVGGDFYYDPPNNNITENILLIAGGVGINPLYSILNHITDIRNSSSACRTTLLYSATTESELIFKNTLDALSSKQTTVKYYTTKSKSDSPQITFGRINGEDIKELVSNYGPDQLRCFLCGPPSMIEGITELLHQQGVDLSRIHFEKW